MEINSYAAYHPELVLLCEDRGGRAGAELCKQDRASYGEHLSWFSFGANFAVNH